MRDDMRQVHYPMRNKAEDSIRIGLAEADADLRERHDSLMAELMRRAMEQNPELARQIEETTRQQETVRDLRRAEVVRMYREMQERERLERIANRKIRYDDSRNVNALKGLRRSCDYKSASRAEQIRMEIDGYYTPHGVEPPKELLAELSRIGVPEKILPGNVRRAS